MKNNMQGAIIKKSRHFSEADLPAEYLCIMQNEEGKSF